MKKRGKTTAEQQQEEAQPQSLSYRMQWTQRVSGDLLQLGIWKENKQSQTTA